MEGESSPLLSKSGPSFEPPRSMFFRNNLNDWVPTEKEFDGRQRSFRRRIFMLVTVPESSILAAAFYFILIAAIFASNILMIMQTMAAFQFTPNNCRSCGGDVTYFFEDDDAFIDVQPGVACVCPPQPMEYTIKALDYLMCFFSVEWFLRVLMFVPVYPEPTTLGRLVQWFNYLTSAPIVFDALAVFPYYLENLPKGLVSLRLLRMFRIFQLVRLGQFNSMFLTLTNVLGKSLKYLRLLIIILAFGGAFFGSMVYWLEKGSWMYHEESGIYCFVRLGVDGVSQEPSPFVSIPEAFWWFMVTATTVGYGDIYPTSTGGKWVAIFAMLMGTLTIAFPVSVFSDLWSSELQQVKGFEELNHEEPTDATSEDAKREAQAGKSNEGLHDGQITGYSYQQQEHRPNEVNSLVMEKEDLKNLVACMYKIKESQTRIHSILRKYKIQEEDLEPLL